MAFADVQICALIKIEVDVRHTLLSRWLEPLPGLSLSGGDNFALCSDYCKVGGSVGRWGNPPSRTLSTSLNPGGRISRAVR